MQVRQAANVLELLEFFAERRRPATMTEIAAELDWPRSSTFNIIGTLADKGYLYEPVTRGGYYPTPRWLVAIQAIAEADPLPEPLLALAREIRDATGETTGIASPSGMNAVMLFVAESTQAVRYFAKAGSRVPIHASSVGRALLAQYSKPERESLYRKIDFTGLPPTAPRTPDELEAALSDAEIRGYHQSDSEYVPDLAGVSVTLPWLQRRLALVVAGPRSRCLDRRADTAAIIRHLSAAQGLLREQRDR